MCPTPLFFVATILLFPESAAVWLQGDTAKYRFESGKFKYYHNVTCEPHQRVVVRNIQNGYKRRNCSCHASTCCDHSSEDCLKPMPARNVDPFTTRCWNRSSCRTTISKRVTSCYKNKKKYTYPRYSVVTYVCAPADTMVNMARRVSRSGPSVTVRYSPPGRPGRISTSQTLTCSLESTSCPEQNVSVYAVVKNNKTPKSCLSIADVTMCRRGIASRRLQRQTPFTISLRLVRNSSLPYTWALAEATNSITVRCKVTSEENLGCTPTTDSPTTTPAPSVTSQVVTRSKSASMPGQRAGLPESLPSTAPGGLSDMRSDQGQDGVAKRAAMVGGPVGAVAVLAAAAVLFLVLWRRRIAGRSSKNSQPSGANGANGGTPLSDVSPKAKRATSSHESRDAARDGPKQEHSRPGVEALPPAAAIDLEVTENSFVYAVSKPWNLEPSGPKMPEATAPSAVRTAPNLHPRQGGKDSRGAVDLRLASTDQDSMTTSGFQAPSHQDVDVDSPERHEDEDSYDVLGQRRSVGQGRTDVTYGHLGMSEGPEGDYDHLGAFRKAVPVLDNIYDTSKPTSPTEGAEQNPYDTTSVERGGARDAVDATNDIAEPIYVNDAFDGDRDAPEV